MATSTRHLCRSLRHLSRSGPSKRKWVFPKLHPSTQLQRTLSAVTYRFAEDNGAPGEPLARTAISRSEQQSETGVSSQDDDYDLAAGGLEDHEYLTPSIPIRASDLSPEDRADYDQLSTEDRALFLKLHNHFKAFFETESAQGGEMDELVEQAHREIDRTEEAQLDVDQPRVPKSQLGYWGEDEEDEFSLIPDGDDDMDDDHITTVAESQLDLHRDVRVYTRLAAWELPLLDKYTKPFSPPTRATPLRFRYTTYMGESHPAQNKVVVEFSTKDLLHLAADSPHRISEAQRTKLIKLVGVRYNPSTDVVRMSCEKFGSAAQNKRYLGDLVGTLIKEAKDKRVMFEDVPLDFRHHKPKSTPRYPEAWKLKQSNIKSLRDQRQKQKLIAEPDRDRGQVEADMYVDGERLVKQYVRTGAVHVGQRVMQ